LVPTQPAPVELLNLKNTLVVGLRITPDRLMQIRRNRLLGMGEDTETDYADEDAVREEVRESLRLFERMGWPSIDVSRRSVEETAAAILNLIAERRK
jgi:regulator of PEP synthase PpsR (kinase-PPPase family)